ncbi:hypothetical protein MPLB_40064 [Mesorhizobium sp. ORS 3324]|nr:hypothetical protein MPLB_40064 [Mesorhizobium sp. ORS 3324]
MRSISSSMKRSSSTWVSCSSRIDCISWGVITSDWDCLSCSLAASAMVEFKRLVYASEYHFPVGHRNWPGFCLSSQTLTAAAYRSVIREQRAENFVKPGENSGRKPDLHPQRVKPSPR